MKKQWENFLAEKPIWPYGIAPALVASLDKAIKSNDDKGVQEAIDGLTKQGIILNHNGNLQYYANDILKNL